MTLSSFTMKFKILLFAACALTLSGAETSSSVSAPRILPMSPAVDTPVTITLDDPDWTYELGAPATFRLTVTAQPYPAGGVPINYRLGPEMLEGDEKHAVVPPEGLALTTAGMTQPGFLRCIVTGELDGKKFRAVATAGFAPDKITPTQTEPADFDAFWAEQKTVLAGIPADYQLIPAPALSTPEVEVSYLSFQNIGNWAGYSRFYGVLCVPRGPGPFPAVLDLPGAGVRPYSGRRDLAARGVITLQVGIHGIPVDLPREIYDQLDRGALASYDRNRLDDRNTYYYRRVYLGCLRANDYLATHPKWDGKNLLVTGGSQGGQLSIMTAALDPRVTALAASHPAYSDVTGYLHGRAGGWPGLFRPQKNGQPGDQPVEPKRVTSAYYDTLNFARRLKVPGFYFWGYNDDVCPPTSLFAVYNIITAPKQLTLALEQSHRVSPEQGALINAWIGTQLGLK